MPLLADTAISWIRRILPPRVSRAVAFGLGCFWFALGALAQIPIQSLVGPGTLPFIAYFPMVLFAGLTAGGTGGLTCLLAAALWSGLAVLPPEIELAFADPEDNAKLLVFLVTGGLVAYTSALLRDVILRLDDAHAEAQRWAQSRDQMTRELEHRIKNLFAIVLGIANRSSRADAPPRENFAVFEQRVLALASAQSLLAAGRWTGAQVSDVIKAALAPFEETCPGQIRLEANGDSRISEQSAVSLALALHELATNAMKYGALSVKTGHVAIMLGRDESPERLALRWQEQGGPPCVPPEAAGFGTDLIKSAFAEEAESEVRLSYAPGGLECAMAYRPQAGASAAPIYKPAERI